MKIKHILMIFLTGILLTIAGAFFKITHISIGGISGKMLIAIGSVIETLAVILMIIKLFINEKFRDFLNR